MYPCPWAFYSPCALASVILLLCPSSVSLRLYVYPSGLAHMSLPLFPYAIVECICQCAFALTHVLFPNILLPQHPLFCPLALCPYPKTIIFMTF